jgi:hypothetical protein
VYLQSSGIESTAITLMYDTAIIISSGLTIINNSMKTMSNYPLLPPPQQHSRLAQQHPEVERHLCRHQPRHIIIRHQHQRRITIASHRPFS